MTGNAEPETVNPDPVTAAEFTVTADVPVDFKVTVWVADEFKHNAAKGHARGINAERSLR